MNSADSQVELAISRVLAAERSANAAVQASSGEAQALIEQARVRAKRIGDRTGHRLQRWTQQIEADAGRDIAALNAALEATPATGADDDARLHALVTQIALALIGNSP